MNKDPRYFTEVFRDLKGLLHVELSAPVYFIVISSPFPRLFCRRLYLLARVNVFENFLGFFYKILYSDYEIANFDLSMPVSVSTRQSKKYPTRASPTKLGMHGVRFRSAI